MIKFLEWTAAMLVLAVGLCAWQGCEGSTGPADSGVADSGGDQDAGPDGGDPLSTDSGEEAGADLGADLAADPGSDPGSDSGSDAGTDAGGDQNTTLPVVIGANTHLPAADALDLANELGLEWVRIDFNWDIGEPSNGTYDWTVFDRVIGDARARGLKVFATVGYGAAWASTSGDRDGKGPQNDVPNAAEYQQFVRDAAARYADGRVQAWGTWNEPNLGDFFEGTRDEWLSNAFGPAIDGIRAGCPSCLVVGPELASIGDSYADYLQAALRARGADLDAISWHIYSAFSEDDSGAGITKDSFYNDLDAHRLIQVGGITVYEGPLSVREVAVAEGFAATPIWITETGYNAPMTSVDDLAAQRLYYQRVVAAQQTRPWWPATFFYELTEEHPGGLWPDSNWGLALRVADPDGSYADNFERKPAFDWLKGFLAGP